MRWTILTDNRTTDNRLLTEHGLSVYVETSRHKLLLDTGASDVFARNAECLGINLADVDYVFISHGHCDHAGGLRAFLKINSKAQVILSPHCIDRQFYSNRNGLHSITAEWKGVDLSRFIFVDEDRQIADDIRVILPSCRMHPLPQGNSHLLSVQSIESLSPDDFCHELVLYADGLLFTGCAHSGLENILDSFKHLSDSLPSPLVLHSVLGGFHLLDDKENADELLRLASQLRTKWSDVSFYTGHCTGDHALQTMQSVSGLCLNSFYCGMSHTTNNSI